MVRVWDYRGQEEFADGSGRSGCTGVAVCWRVYVQTAPLVVVVVVVVLVVVCVCVARHPSEGSVTCRRHWAFWRLSLSRFSALRVP